jgi:hypothetical protein
MVHSHLHLKYCLSEGRAGEAWGLSKKTVLSGISRDEVEQKRTLILFSLCDIISLNCQNVYVLTYTLHRHQNLENKTLHSPCDEGRPKATVTILVTVRT